MEVEVVDSHSGDIVRLKLHENVLVRELQDAIKSLCSVPTAEQILLCRGVRPHADHPVSLYTSQNERIFLFRKGQFSNLAQSVHRPQIESFWEVPALSRDLPAGFATQPVLDKVQTLERLLATHCDVAQAIHSNTEKRVAVGMRYVEQCGLQHAAIQCALQNLTIYYKTAKQQSLPFFKSFKESKERNEALLASFESDIAALGKTKLHHSLRTADHKCLLDVCPEDQIRRWKDRALSRWGQQVTKAEEAEHALTSRVHEGIAALQARASGGGSGAEAQGRSLIDLVEEMDKMKHAVTESLSLRDTVFTVAKEVQKMVADGHLAEALALSEQSHSTQSERLLPRMLELDKMADSFMRKAQDAKAAAHGALQRDLQAISELQSVMREVGNRVAIYEEALAKYNQEFFRLTVVHNLPETYREALLEVVRRRRFGRDYMTFVTSATEKLARMRAQEKVLRETFYGKWGIMLPSDLVPGIQEQPPSVDVQTPSFDTALPHIDTQQEVFELFPDFAAPPTSDHMHSNSPPDSNMSSITLPSAGGGHDSALADLLGSCAHRPGSPSGAPVPAEFARLLAEKDATITDLKKALSSAPSQERIASLEGEIAELVAKCTQLETLTESRAREYESNVESLKRELVGETERRTSEVNKEKESALAQARNELESLAKQLEEGKAREDALIDEIRKQSEETDKIHANELGSLRAAIADLEKQCECHLATRDDLEGKLRAADGKYESVCNERDSLAQQIESLKTIHAQALANVSTESQQRLETERTEQESRIALLQSEITKLREQVLTIEATNRELKAEAQQRAAELSQAEGNVSKLETLRQTLEGQIAALNRAINEHGEYKRATDQKLEEQSQSIAESAQQLERHKAEHARALSERAALELQKAEVEEECGRWKQMVANLQEELGESKKSLELARIELQQAKQAESSAAVAAVDDGSSSHSVEVRDQEKDKRKSRKHHHKSSADTERDAKVALAEILLDVCTDWKNNVACGVLKKIIAGSDQHSMLGILREGVQHRLTLHAGFTQQTTIALMEIAKLLQDKSVQSALEASVLSIERPITTEDLQPLIVGVEELIHHNAKLVSELAEMPDPKSHIVIAHSNFRDKDVGMFAKDAKGNFRAMRFTKSADASPPCFLNREFCRTDVERNFLLASILMVDRRETDATMATQYGVPAGTPIVLAVASTDESFC